MIAGLHAFAVMFGIVFAAVAPGFLARRGS